MKNPSQRLLDLMPEIIRLYGPAIKKGWVGRVYIQEEYDLSQSEARHVVAHIQDEFEIETEDGEILEKGTYEYHPERDLYIIYSRDGKLPVDGADVRDIRRAYSNLTGKGDTVREIAHRYDHLSLREIMEVLRVMKVTHYSTPFTDEEIEDRTVDDLRGELLRQRKIKIAKDFEHESITEVKKKAKQWDLFEYELGRRREQLITDLKEYAPVVPKKKEIVTLDDPHTALIFPADIHFGKLATFETTGTVYNLEICRNVVLEHLTRVLEQLKRGYDIEKIHLVVGNDWFHIDTAKMTTTSGTPLHAADSPLVVMREGRKLAVEVVLHILNYFDNIKITTALSNHDYIAGGALIDYLEAYFHSDERVDVEVSLKHRNYFVEGNTLYGITHGDGAKAADLPLIMAQEAKELWGQTIFREFFQGHLHHLRAKTHFDTFEYNGVRVHNLPSLSATDDWHYLNGFVQSVRSMEAHVIHPAYGLVGKVASNMVPDLRSELTMKNNSIPV